MTYLVQVTFPYVTGIPTDCSVNTFHFNWINPGDPESADYLHLDDALNTFYTYVFNASAAVMLMSGIVDNQHVNTKIYDLTEPEPRAPKYDSTNIYTVGVDVAFNTPLEVACCLSYQGAKVSGLDMASRRGRIYLGPLGDIANGGGSTTTFPAPPSAWVTRIVTAAHQLTVDTIGNGWEWVVYSRKNNTSTAIINGWVDNAWDTQRRRGNAPSSRVTWTAFLP